MYTSKRINSRRAEMGYASNGTPYKPKQKIPDRIVGKQFMISKMKNGQRGYFTDMTYAPETYVDKTPYVGQQPVQDRKLGFGSHDAKRRDEFSALCRQEQWRDSLANEQKFMNKWNAHQTQNEGLSPEEQQQEWLRVNANAPGVEKFGYFEGRRVGGCVPTSLSYGQFAVDPAWRANLTARPTSRSALVRTGLSATTPGRLARPPSQQQTKKMTFAQMGNNKYFTPNATTFRHGRKHTMAEFYDNLHI